MQTWEEAPPTVGMQAKSGFVAINGLNIAEAGDLDQAACYGWVQSADSSLVPCTYLGNPGWIGRDMPVATSSDPELAALANKLVNWARFNTYSTFRELPLGIVIEFKPDATYYDPSNPDALPHLDWSDGRTPAVLILGAASVAGSRLYEGEYTYAGNSQDGKRFDRYVSATKTLWRLITQLGTFYATDLRRGLHSGPPATPTITDTPRPVIRAFIAPYAQTTTAD